LLTHSTLKVASTSGGSVNGLFRAEGAGFGTDNVVTIITAKGKLPMMEKRAVAEAVLDEAAALLAQKSQKV